MECLFISKLKIWTRCTTNKIKQEKKLMDRKRSINVNEEYQGAIRSKSFVDFFSKAQLLVRDQSLSMSTQSYCHRRVLLEPDQETIDTVLESKTMSKNSNMKALILDYFDISSEASNMCTKLLKSIFEVQSSYASVQQILHTIVEDYSSKFDGVTDSKLCNVAARQNIFSNISKYDFEMICSKYSSTLQKMKVKRRKIARKMKLISCFNKASRICVATTCCVVAVTAMVLAAHSLTALVTGPVILSLPLKPLNKKLGDLQLFSSRFLRRDGDQLDVAMKGTYILNKDFDTISRLVNRLHDDIEWNRKMVDLCLANGRGEDKICSQVLRELEKSDVWFRKQVEELEEHVYLCLLTINKARALVIKELYKSCNI